jgi:hypothetical protein
VELVEVLSDILVFGVEEGVDDVGEGGVVGDVVHAGGCGDDWVGGEVLVVMRLRRRAGRSRADWMSPRKREWEVVGSVKTLLLGWYSCSR